jgi:(+)-trans-carveol dehydrogenase
VPDQASGAVLGVRRLRRDGTPESVPETGRVAGKVAFITGAARGQGRSHAIRLAEEGADIIAIDLCAQVESVPYRMATPDDLRETVDAVEALDRRIVAREADVRDYDAVEAALEAGVAELGRLDIVCANAGIGSFAPAAELSEQAWQEVIDINLTGVWNTCKAALAHISDGGSLVLTSSAAGLKGMPNVPHYAAAKHGVVGLMRTLALQLAPRMIRVNSVHPTTVDTPMVRNDALFALFRPDLEHPTVEDFFEPATAMNMLPIPWIEPRDVSNAVLFLACDESRYITGVTLPIDAGATQK